MNIYLLFLIFHLHLSQSDGAVKPTVTTGDGITYTCDATENVEPVCSTLSAAIARTNTASSSSGNKITIARTLTENSVAEIVQSVDILGQSDASNANKPFTWTPASGPANALISVGASDSATAKAITVTMTNLDIVLTQGYTFSTAIFVLQSNSSGSYTYARALSLTSITVKSSSTTTSVSAPAIINALTGTLTLTGCSFTGISLTSDNAHLILFNTDPDQLVLSNNDGTPNTFTSITANSDGAVFGATLNSTAQVSIDNAEFKGCSSKAGVMCFTVLTGTPAAAISIADAFSGKTDNEVTVKYYESGSEDPVFTEISAWNTDATNCAVVFIASTITDFQQTSKFTISSSGTAQDFDDSNMEKKYYGKVSTGTAYPLVHFIKSPAQSASTSDHTVLLHPSGTGETTGSYCGWSESPCSTLAAALTACANAVPGTPAIRIPSSATVTPPSTSIDSALSLSGEAASATLQVNHIIEDQLLTITATVTVSTLTVYLNSPTGQAVQATVFLVKDNGDLTLTSVTFQPATAGTNPLETQNEGAITKSVIDSTAGTLTLSSCKFTYLQMGAAPLLAVSTTGVNTEAKFKIDDGSSATHSNGDKTVFEDITRTTGSGAVLAVTLTSGTQLDLTEATFSDCSCASTGAVAGAVYVILTGTGGTLTFTSTTFGSGTGGSNAYQSALTLGSKGGIHFGSRTGNTFSGYLASINTADSNWYGSNEQKYYAAIVTGDDNTASFVNTLATYYPATTTMAEPAVLSSPGGDVPGCGASQLPCATLTETLKHATEQDSRKSVSIPADTTIAVDNIVIELDSAVTVTGGDSSTSVLAMSEPSTTPAAVVNVKATTGTEVIFSTLKVTLESIQPLESGTASLLTIPPFTLTGTGTLKLDTVTFESIVTDKSNYEAAALPSLVTATAGTLELVSVTANNIDTLSANPLITVTGTASLSITGTSSFTGASATGATAAVLHVELANTATLTLSSVSFSGKVTSNEDTKASVCYVDNTAGGTISVSNPTFTTLASGTDLVSPFVFVLLADAATDAQKQALHGFLPSNYDHTTDSAKYQYKLSSDAAAANIETIPLPVYVATTVPEQNPDPTCLSQTKTSCTTISSAIDNTNGRREYVTGSPIVLVYSANSFTTTVFNGNDAYALQKSVSITGQHDTGDNKDTSVAVAARTNAVVAVGGTGVDTDVHVVFEKLAFILNKEEIIQGSVFTLTKSTSHATELELVSVSFSRSTDGTEKPLQAPIIKAISGTLTLKGVSAESISITGHALIESSATASVTFSTTTSTFKTITRTDAPGAAAIDAKGALDLSSASFTSCGTSAAGIGCAVKITLSDSTLTATDSAFIYAGNNNGKYYGMWIEGTKDQVFPAVKTDTSKSVAALAAASLSGVNWVSNNEKKHYITLSESISAPLSHAFYPPVTANPNFNQQIPVSFTGLDVPGCGWTDVPCATAETALARLGNLKTITLKPSTAYTDAHIKLTIPSATVIVGEDTTQVTLTNTPYNTDASSLLTVKKMTIIPTASAKPFLINTGTAGATLQTIIFGSDAAEEQTALFSSLITSSNGQLTLERVCAYHLSPAAALVSVTGGSVEVKGSSIFTAITNTATTSPNFNGGALSVSVPESKTCTITATAFTACSAKNGGAVYISTAADADDVNIGDSVSFTACQAIVGTTEGYGGSLYIDADSAITFAAMSFTPTTTINGATVTASADEGVYFYYHAETEAGQHTTFDAEAASFTLTTGTIVEHEFMYNDGTDTVSLFAVGTVSVSQSGDETTNCGTTSAPCTTLARAVASTRYAQATFIRIAKNLNTAQTATATIAKKMMLATSPRSTAISVTVGTLTDNEPVIKLSGSTAVDDFTLSVEYLSFTVSSSPCASPVFGIDSTTHTPTLSLSHVVFGRAGATDTYTNSLIQAASGVVNMDTVTFQKISITEASTPLVAASTATLTLSTCTFSSITLDSSPLLTINTAQNKFSIQGTEKTAFTSITRSSGHGAVFELELSTASTHFTLQNAAFKECVCTQQRAAAGAVFIVLDGEDGVLTLTQGTVTFERDMTVNNTAAFDYAAVSGITLGTKGASLGTTTEGYAKQIHDFMGGTDAWNSDNTFTYTAALVDSAGTPHFPAPLKTYITPTTSITGDFYADANGADLASCGIQSIPCLTLSTLPKTITTNTIHITGTITHSTQLAVTGLTVKGASAETDILSITTPSTSIATAYFFAESTSNVEFNTLKITIASKAKKAIDASDAKVENTLIHSETTGIVTLTGVKVEWSGADGTTQEDSPLKLTLIVLTTGTLTLTSTSFTGIKLGTDAHLIDTKTDANLVLDGATFTSISLNNKPLLNVAFSDAFQIIKTNSNKNTAFITITRGSGNGAVIEDTIADGKTLNLDYADFTACTTRSGQGGTLHLTLEANGHLTLTGSSFHTSADDSVAWSTASSAAIFFAASSFSILTSYSLDTQLSGQLTADLKNKYYAKIGTAPVVQLYYYYATPTSPLHVDGTENKYFDYDKCGYEGAQCVTLSAATKQKPTAITLLASTIKTDENNAEVEITSGVAVTGAGKEAERGTVLLAQGINADTRSGVITLTPQTSASFTASFSSLRIHIDSVADLSHPVFFIKEVETSKTVTLSLNTVHFAPAPTSGSPLGASVIDTRNGILSLTSTSFESIRLVSSPLLAVSSAQDSLVMEGTNTFTSITRQTGSGSVFDVSLSSSSASLQINAASFDRCGCEHGSGGAVYTELSSGTFVLGDSSTPNTANANPTVSFTNCYAQSTNPDDKTAGNGGSIFVNVPKNAENVKVTVAQVEVSDSTASSSGGGMYVAVAEETEAVAVTMEQVDVKSGKADTGAGGGIYVDVGKDTTGVSVSVSEVSVSDSTASAEAKGDAIYLSLKSNDTTLALKSVSIEAATDPSSPSTSSTPSTVYVAVTNTELANNASLWKELKTVTTSETGQKTEAKDSDSGSASFIIATQDEKGEELSVKSTQKIIEESNAKDDDGLSTTAIVIIIVASVVVVVVVVVIIILCCCCKDSSSKESTYEASMKPIEMKEEEEQQSSDLADIVAPTGVDSQASVEEDQSSPSSSSLATVTAPPPPTDTSNDESYSSSLSTITAPPPPTDTSNDYSYSSSLSTVTAPPPPTDSSNDYSLTPSLSTLTAPPPPTDSSNDYSFTPSAASSSLETLTAPSLDPDEPPSDPPPAPPRKPAPTTQDGEGSLADVMAPMYF